MDASEQTRLRALVNSQAVFRGAAIIHQNGMQQDVVQRAAAGTAGAGLCLIVCKLGGDAAAGRPLPSTSAQLRALGISPAGVAPVGRTTDGYTLYVASNDAVGSGPRRAAGTAAPLERMVRMQASLCTLQEAIQMESRKFQTLSNASKARHDVAMNSIRNLK